MVPALAGHRAVSANTPVRFSSLKHFGNRVLGCCLTKTVGGWNFKIGEVKKKRKETTILLSGPNVLGGRTKWSKETKGNFLRTALASIINSLLTPY